MRVLAGLLLAAALAGCVTPFNAPVPDIQGPPPRLADGSPGSQLQIDAVQGLRQHAEGAIDRLVLNVTSAPGGFPVDLTKLVVRYEARDRTLALQHGAGFAVAWIEGGGDDARFEPDDRVAITLRVPPLREGTPGAIRLVPDVGASAEARFFTPATYGDAIVIGLA